MSDPAALELVGSLLARVAHPAVRQRVQRVLALWDLGYLREALSQFRVTAEEALRCIVQRKVAEGEQRELCAWLERGHSAKLIQYLYRDYDVLPARIALHLHTLLAWGNYASHYQRTGHFARPSDLAVLISIMVDLEHWMATECGDTASIFEGGDLAWALHEAQADERYGSLSPELLRHCLESAEGVVRVEPHRLTALPLSFELVWRPSTTLSRSAVPYRGLQAFDLEDTDHFYGRSALRERLEHYVDTHRLTVVSGASGSGKTSLLRAGLLPFLLDLGCGVLLVSDYSARGLEAISPIVALWPARPLVVILDQFERALLPGAPTALLDQLLKSVASWAPGRPGLRVVLAIREDCLGKLLRRVQGVEHGHLFGKDHALCVVGPLGDAEAREAILKPLESTGVAIEEEFLDHVLLPELLGTSGALPAKLQLTCSRLFAEARASHLSAIGTALYRRCGGTEKILASYLETTLSSPHYEGTHDLARAALRAMTDGEGSRWVDLGELWLSARSVAPPTDEVQLTAVLEQLSADRLVMTRSGLSPGHTEYTLLHDHLAPAARHWTTSTELEIQLAQGRLDQALQTWPDQQQRELLRGRALKLVELHWHALRQPNREAATSLLVASRRARRLRLLATAVLLAAAVLGLSFGASQLWRATVERDRAVAAADQGILLQAQLALEQDPALAVAWLRNLSPAATSYGLLTFIEEARRRGIATVLEGHQQLVTSVAFSPDGTQLVTASRDGTLRSWEVHEHRSLGRSWRGHQGFVNRVIFAPQGRQVASAGADGTVRWWDAASGRLLATLRGHHGPVYGLCFAAGGRFLASAGADRKLRLWDVARQRLERELATSHTQDVLALACSAAGDLVATASLDGTAELWDLRSNAQRGPPLRGHQQGVYALAFAPDGQHLASASRDGTVRLWDVASQREDRQPLMHADEWLLSVAFSPDGRIVAAAGSAKVVHVWEVATGRPLATLRGHLGFVHEIAFSPRGKLLASGGHDHMVRLWDLSAQQAPAHCLEGHLQEIRAIAFSPDGKIIASGSRDRSVRLWDVATRKARGSPLPHPNEVLALAFAPDGRALVAVGAGREVLLWQLQGPPRSERLEAMAGAVLQSVAISPDGATLAAGCADGSIRLWDLRTRKARSALTGHWGAVQALVFTPDSKTLISAGSDRAIVLWDMLSGQPRGSLPQAHGDTIFSLALSADGSKLASGGADSRVRLWDVPRQRFLGQPLAGHRHWVLSLALSRDGSLLASGSSDGTVRIWDVRRQRQLGLPLLGHEDWVYAVAFAPGSQLLASASADRTVRLWQLSAQDPRHLRRVLDGLTNVHVSLDGTVEVR